MGLKQRVSWHLEMRGGWCFVRVVFIVVVIDNSVGGGENDGEK